MFLMWSYLIGLDTLQCSNISNKPAVAKDRFYKTDVSRAQKFPVIV